ncbi:MAG: 3'-5' exonuclease domain-containing protein 2 [Bacteroidales bacterium]|nr:3'-5' exonuclease domain-containing protein 2 [Bacteroidales bacterium]
MFKISVEATDIEKMPLGTFPGEIKVISKAGLEYERAIFYLRRQKILGFDTESRPVFSPGQHNHGVALLQLSGPKRAYLFRVQELGMRKSLCSVLSSKSILKVGAAVLDDIHGLQKLRKFEPAGFVDLQKIAWEWGIRDKSVKKLAANILECRISKAQQLSNWEAEELSPSQCNYAATDAWVCREMYLKLLECEKHPLSPEEMLPPQDRIAHEAAVERKEANIAAEKARAGTSKRKRHRKKKKPADNGKDNTEKGQG